MSKHTALLPSQSYHSTYWRYCSLEGYSLRGCRVRHDWATNTFFWCGDWKKRIDIINIWIVKATANWLLYFHLNGEWEKNLTRQNTTILNQRKAGNMFFGKSLNLTKHKNILFQNFIVCNHVSYLGVFLMHDIPA